MERLRRKREDTQGGPGISTHGVDVGQAIGGANPTEEERIIYTRREDIHRLNQAEVLGNPVDGRIVTRRQTRQNRRILHRGKPTQDRFQISRGYL
jgi:hypothetical protein